MIYYQIFLFFIQTYPDDFVRFWYLNLVCGCGLAPLSRADEGLISSDLFLCNISLSNHFDSLLLFSGAVILVCKNVVVAGVLMIFHIKSHIKHTSRLFIGAATQLQTIIWTNYNLHYPRKIPQMYKFFRPSGSWEEDLKKKLLIFFNVKFYSLLWSHSSPVYHGRHNYIIW